MPVIEIHGGVMKMPANLEQAREGTWDAKRGSPPDSPTTSGPAPVTPPAEPGLNPYGVNSDDTIIRAGNLVLDRAGDPGGRIGP